MASKYFKINLDEYREALGLTKATNKGEYLANYFKCLEILDNAYATIYGGLVTMKETLKQSPDVTEAKEEDIKRMMKEIVLISKSKSRMLKTAINEIVPNTFPVSDVGPTSSGDISDEDVKAAAHAICVASLSMGQPEICLAAQVAAAIYTYDW